MTLSKPSIEVRRAQPDDIPEILKLIAEHAKYENGGIPSADENRIYKALFSQEPKLYIWVAVIDNTLGGYLSITHDFSTWQASGYIHIDCLYLRPKNRNLGIGKQLLKVAINAAKEYGFSEIQWQTPEWNLDAMRFYKRFNASDSEKVRFTLHLDQDQIE